MKNVFIGLFLMITVSLSAQTIEKVTYTDFDGKIHTVNATFGGYGQTQYKLVKRYGVSILENWTQIKLGNSEWSKSSFVSSKTFSYDDLQEKFNSIELVYQFYPDVGTQTDSIVSKFYIPNGKTKPFWWAPDAKSYFIFYKFWFIQ